MAGPAAVGRKRYQGAARCQTRGRITLYNDSVKKQVEDVKQCMKAVGHRGMHEWGYHVWGHDWKGNR